MNSLILGALLAASSPSQEGMVACAYWQERIVAPSQRSSAWQQLQSSVPQSKTGTTKDPWGVAAMNEKEKLRAVHCLLQSKGDGRDGAISGVTSTAISQTFVRSRAELSALYMISYLYEGRIDHASAVALGGEGAASETAEGRYETRSAAIVQAYESYQGWFAKVCKVGLSKAKLNGLDPLEGTGLRWYGNRPKDKPESES